MNLAPAYVMESVAEPAPSFALTNRFERLGYLHVMGPDTNIRICGSRVAKARVGVANIDACMVEERCNGADRDASDI